MARKGKYDMHTVLATISQKVQVPRGDGGIDIDILTKSGVTHGFCRITQGGIYVAKDRRSKPSFRRWSTVINTLG